MDDVSADTEDLARFVARGERHIDVLRAIRTELGDRRLRVVLALAWAPPPPTADRALDELIDRAVVGTTFVDVVADALLAFDPDDGTPEASVLAAVVDAGLAEAGLGPATLRTTPYAIGRLADGLADRDLDGADVETDVGIAGRAYQRITATIDNGDDLGMSNGELNRVNDLLAELDPAGADLVVTSLTTEQLRVLFHNVHSSSFWSNDWDDRERTEFYAIFGPMSTEAKAYAGRYSPYLAALAEAERAAVGQRGGQRALVSLHTSDAFTGELGFDERIALLAQAANYPDAISISNLDRLAGQDWFQRFDLADSQRTAKMVAYLSQHPGDPVVIANTLDLFLAPDAPYRFDWEQERRAYGSARGELFHLNRVYLEGGNGPVDASVPSGEDLDDTLRMVTHTVVHEVNHLVNGDVVAESFEYFMGEYRAFYVGHVAAHGAAPTRDDVRGRVETLLTTTGNRAYARITRAVDDPIEGPRIAAFVEDIIGRPVTAADVADEIRLAVTDPTVLAPVPVPVDGGPNILDNVLPPSPR